MVADECCVFGPLLVLGVSLHNERGHLKERPADDVVENGRKLVKLGSEDLKIPTPCQSRHVSLGVTDVLLCYRGRLNSIALRNIPGVPHRNFISTRRIL